MSFYSIKGDYCKYIDHLLKNAPTDVVESVLDSLPKRKHFDFIKKHYFYIDNRKRIIEIAKARGISRVRVYQIVNMIYRMLSHPTRRKILERSNPGDVLLKIQESVLPKRRLPKRKDKG